MSDEWNYTYEDEENRPPLDTSFGMCLEGYHLTGQFIPYENFLYFRIKSEDGEGMFEITRRKIKQLEGLRNWNEFLSIPIIYKRNQIQLILQYTDLSAEACLSRQLIEEKELREKLLSQVGMSK